MSYDANPLDMDKPPSGMRWWIECFLPCAIAVIVALVVCYFVYQRYEAEPEPRAIAVDLTAMNPPPGWTVITDGAGHYKWKSSPIHTNALIFDSWEKVISNAWEQREYWEKQAAANKRGWRPVK